MQRTEAMCVSVARCAEFIADGSCHASDVTAPSTSGPLIWMPAAGQFALPFFSARRSAEALSEWHRESARVREEGIQLCRAEDGSPVFNFAQRIWLYPGVGMEWSTRPTQAAQNLAANILAPFLPVKGRFAYLCPECLKGRKTAQHGLAWQFARQVLVPLNRKGVMMDPAFLEEWVLIHLTLLHEFRQQVGTDQGPVAPLPRRSWVAPLDDLS